jgi:ankyrin repeat protein
LIGRKADVNVKDKNGKTAFMLAFQGHHYEVCKLLVRAGARKMR